MTLLGIVIEVRFTQPAKAPAPIIVTLLEILIDFKLRHRKYLQPIITQYFIDNKSEIWSLPLIVHSKG